MLMSGLQALKPEAKIHLYRVEAVTARLKAYASKLSELEHRALSKAKRSGEPMRTLYLREAENARLSRELMEHAALMLEHLVSIIGNRGVDAPTVRLAIDDALEKISKMKLSSMVSGGPAALLAEAESSLYELRNIGGA